MHAFDAVDLLLQRNGDGRLDDRGICSDVIAGDVDLRGREIRVQRNRQGRYANRSGEDDQQGTNRRKNRPLNEKINQKSNPFVAPLLSWQCHYLVG